MCVMDCLVFTGSGTFHITRSHTSHLPVKVTPRGMEMCAGMFHLSCGYMALGLGTSDMGSMAGFMIPRV